MNENDPNGTEFILPIICSNCGHQLDLSMAFELQDPKKEITNTNENIIEETEA